MSGGMLATWLIDHHMPGMNGLDVVGALHREGTALPTILVTGRLDAGIAERAAKLGVTEILEKPFSTARLAQLIRAELSRSS
jgi:FixJ family two-component response regulator